MVSCERCGSANVAQIAAGFYESREATVEDVIGPRGPGGTPGPVGTQLRRCGHQFHTADVNRDNPCSCGIGSIGSCKDCGAHVCGHHGALYQGSFLCAGCQDARYKASPEGKRAAAVAERKAEENRKRDAEQRSRWDAMDAAAKEIKAATTGRELAAALGAAETVTGLHVHVSFGAVPPGFRFRPWRGRHYSVALKTESVTRGTTVTDEARVAAASGKVLLMSRPTYGGKAKYRRLGGDDPLPPGVASKFASAVRR